ncbi:transcriptional regulator, MarR family with acetyltransferase activity [Seinonella peptonophila]|uniref:Transcriptional regulator, MarR family with acetyltransferase activity n=1 Tax=Seinonella peptonophila TaxID=112248 RepID=A0A1M5BFS8_9BACL|nr:helix-turn-helix domain-containing GNAT family N-acetyltransferase [Seinonella peptonophila]SHF41433.1 transcriptional regulator, MarR family with acetyltransferase activity [Seinonella peptonophila]
MSISTLEERIHIIRHFNRFITKQIGVLNEGLLQTTFTLTEARLIFELANHQEITSSELIEWLGLDRGYLSRLIKSLESNGIVTKTQSKVDGRHRLLKLTSEGLEAAKRLNQRSQNEIIEMLSHISEEDQERLCSAMKTIENIMKQDQKKSEVFILRSHEPGDIGWITYRHACLYAREYGWNEHFEAMVAEILAKFVKNFNPEKEKCWIAEMDNKNVGSILVTQENEEIARLRMLLVEPKARGLGLGTRLVSESIRFAKKRDYKKLVLWTNNVLLSARNIYKSLGFQCVDKKEHQNFGPQLIGETWELSLD